MDSSRSSSQERSTQTSKKTLNLKETIEKIEPKHTVLKFIL